MKRVEKEVIIDSLSGLLAETPHLYFMDASRMNVAQVNALRRLCFAHKVRYRVLKNTLIRQAIARQNSRDFSALPQEVLKGFTGVMFENERAATCAKLIKDFHKEEGLAMPVLKAACIGEDMYVGNKELDALARLKSREELLGVVLGMLQRPAKDVIGALKNPAARIAGVLEVLLAKDSSDKKPN